MVSNPSNSGTETSDATPPAQAPLNNIARLLWIVASAATAMLAIWLIGGVLMVLFAATLFAVVLHGLSDMLRRHSRLPYGASLAVVCVLIIGAVTGAFWIAGPDIVAQFSSLRSALTTQAAALRSSIDASPEGHMIMDYLPAPLGSQSSGSLESLGSRIAGSMTGMLGSAFGALGTLAVVLIAGIYFAANPTLYANGLLRIVPPRYRPTAREILLTAARTLRAWVAGQALDMAVVGLLSGFGLWMIGVPLAFGLGLLAAMCNFIPYIGAFLGAAPALLLALSLGVRETAMVAALYAVIQFFEGNVMAPFIQRRAVDMPPAVTLLSQTLFGAIFGFPGLMLASPLTAALLAVGDKVAPKLDKKERL